MRPSRTDRPLLLLLAGSMLLLSGGRQAPAPPHHPDRVAVKLAPGTTLARTLVAAELRGTDLIPIFPDPDPAMTPRAALPGALAPEPLSVRRARRERFGLDRWFLLELAPEEEVEDALERLAGDLRVERAEPDGIGRAAGAAPRALQGAYLPTDPLFAQQWYLQQPSDADIDMPGAWEQARDARSVPVAVLDTGVDPDHPDLRDALLWDYGWDYVNGDAEPLDDRGHGTHVTGLLAARADNGTGIAGAAFRSRVVPLKVLASDLSGFYTWWASGFVYAADLGVRVINLSAGGASDSALLHDAVAYARDRGTAVFAAMMNENSDVPYYPAAYEETIAVGATDASDRRADPFYWWNGAGEAPGSSFGPHIDLVAPGDSLLSTLPAYLGSSYGLNGGTSMAAPLAAGTAALLLARRPDLTPEMIRGLLRDGAEDQVGRPSEDTAGFDVYHGAGRLNADVSLQLLVSSIPDPPFIVLHPRPNPSRGLVRFPVPGHLAPPPLTLRIYDVRGRVIHEQTFPDPPKEAVWEGRDRTGRRVPSGVYLFEFVSSTGRTAGKFTIIR